MFNEGFTEYQDSLRESPIQRRLCYDGSPGEGAPSQSAPSNGGGSYRGDPNDYGAYSRWESGQPTSQPSSPSNSPPGPSINYGGGYGIDPFAGSDLGVQPEIRATGSAFGPGGPLQDSSGLYGNQVVGSPGAINQPASWYNPSNNWSPSQETGPGWDGGDSVYIPSGREPMGWAPQNYRDNLRGYGLSNLPPSESLNPLNARVEGSLSLPSLTKDPNYMEVSTGGYKDDIVRSIPGPNPNFTPPVYSDSKNVFTQAQEGFGNWWTGLGQKGGALYVPPGGSSTPGLTSKGEKVG